MVVLGRWRFLIIEVPLYARRHSADEAESVSGGGGDIKAHRWLYHSTLGSRVIKKRRRRRWRRPLLGLFPRLVGEIFIDSNIKSNIKRTRETFIESNIKRPPLWQASFCSWCQADTVSGLRRTQSRCQADPGALSFPRRLAGDRRARTGPRVQGYLAHKHTGPRG